MLDYSKLFRSLTEMVGRGEEGSEFEVIFIKKDGTERTMKCRLTEAGGNLAYGYLPVFEEGKGHKLVNLNTIKQVTVTLFIDKEKSEWTRTKPSKPSDESKSKK